MKPDGIQQANRPPRFALWHQANATNGDTPGSFLPRPSSDGDVVITGLRRENMTSVARRLESFQQRLQDA